MYSIEMKQKRTSATKEQISYRVPDVLSVSYAGFLNAHTQERVVFGGTSCS